MEFYIHDLDDLAGRRPALKAQDLQLLDHEDGILALVLLTASPRVLAHHHGLLVHDGVSHVEVGVGLLDLGDLPHLLQVLAWAGLTSKIGRRRVGKECRSRWSPYH